jgi:putative DNA primase/helicase
MDTGLTPASTQAKNGLHRADTTASDHVLAFRRDMEKHGILFKGALVPDTPNFQRVHIEGHKKGRRNGWYRLRTDGIPAGSFGDFTRQLSVTWSAKGVRPLTREERRAMARKIKADRERRDAAERAAHEKAAARANTIWDAAKPAPNDHPYLARKGVPSFGLRVGNWPREWVDGDGEVHQAVPNALLVPIRGAGQVIYSLQAIFADGTYLERDKDFLLGGRKQGLYFVIGKPRPHPDTGIITIIICEGYATAASIHLATGEVVVVAFDAGNLAHVARVFRAALPTARILVGGDNDAWSDGNPGARYAAAAAEAVDDVAIIPRFKDVADKPTDFNDLHRLEGLDEVKRQIEVEVTVEREAGAPPSHAGDTKARAEAEDRKADAEAQAGDAPSTGSADAARGEFVDDDQSGYFKTLGHDHGRFFFWQHEAKQVLHYSGTELMGDGAFSDLAPLLWWERKFNGGGDTSDRERKKLASDWLKRTSYSRGIFNSRNKIRRRGAWMDDGRVVFHFGSQLTVDGVETAVHQIKKSRYIYELREELQMPSQTALTDDEGRHLLKVAGMFKWQKPGYGDGQALYGPTSTRRAMPSLSITWRVTPAMSWRRLSPSAPRRADGRGDRPSGGAAAEYRLAEPNTV